MALIFIRFGVGSRVLSGVYHPASGRLPTKGCVLFCNPFGQEAIRSHRMFRVFADRLSRVGHHVLRFDYFGTGDSAGDDNEGDVDGWIDDLLQAHEELLSRCNCDRSAWFGLRLGASIAALASGRLETPPNRLVLWEPVLDGSSYLGDLADAHVEAARRSYGVRWKLESELRARAVAETAGETLGFPLTAALKAQLSKLTCNSFRVANADQVCLFNDSQTGKILDLRDLLAAKGIKAQLSETRTGIDWTTNEAMNSSIVPTEAIQSIAAALDAGQ